jgi:hypothetical protein
VPTRAGLGSPPDDRTLRRFFSLLDLSVLAAYDLKAPFMSQSAFEETVAGGIDSLAAERDLRGFEPGKGWVLATAHGADLLKFLARNPRGTGATLVRRARFCRVRRRPRAGKYAHTARGDARPRA